MDQLRLQLTHILRRLRRERAFTAITLLTLAIGIGANTTIFTLVYSVLLRPLPYADADRLVGVWQTAPGIGIADLNASPATYFTYREEGRVFQDIGVWTGGSGSVTGDREPEQVETILVSDGTLPLLAVPPFKGRWFNREDDLPGRPETVILSYGYWTQRFGGEDAVVGKSLLLDGRPREIIGVMPEGFEFLNRRPAIYLPLQFDRGKVFIGNFSYQALARLKPNVTLAQANADVARMIAMLPEKFSPAQGLSLEMLRETKMGPNLRPLKNDVVGSIGKMLWVLMATVAIVLLIACANVANLLLVRADGRQQELAVRAALGAGWRHIASGLFLESTVLGLFGGVAGAGLAYASMRLLVYLSPAQLPRLSEISMDPVVLLFTLGISVLAGLLFGFLPVLKYATPKIANALRAGGRTSSDSRERNRTRHALAIVQVALALVLLIGCGLMIRSMRALGQVQPGFTGAEKILTLRISIPNAQVPEPARVARMHNDLAQRLAEIPGVVSVGLTNSVTMDGSNNNDPIFVEDRPFAEGKLPPIRRYKHIGPGYFKTMGNTIVAGRDVDWTDIHEMRPVVIVSENLAREFWPTPQAALGRRIRESPKGVWREIIGVVGDERDNGVENKAPTIIYWPLLKRQFWAADVDVRRTLAFAIRSDRTGSPQLLNDVRNAVWAVNPQLPLANVRTVKELYDRSLGRASFALVMLSIAAVMALILGVVGIYGVISYSISQRTREIGIRIALGAQSGQVQGMFLRHGFWLALAGVGCGIATAIPLARLMESLLFEVSPADISTYGVVSVVLVIATLAAAYLPAQRATKIEPVEALRAE